MSSGAGPYDRARSEELLRALCDVATRLIAFELDSSSTDPDHALSAWHEAAAMVAEAIEILGTIEREWPGTPLAELCGARSAQLFRMARLLATANGPSEQLDAAESAQRELVVAVQLVLAAHEELP